MCMPSFRAYSILPLFLVPGVLFSQTPNGTNPQSSTHPRAMKGHSAASAAAQPPEFNVEVRNGSTVETRVFNSLQPTAEIPETTNSVPDKNRVEVINGAAKRSIVLDTQEPSVMLPPNASLKHGANGHGEGSDGTPFYVNKVETINGMNREIRVFYGNPNEPNGPGSGQSRAQPIVATVVSSATRREGGNNLRIVVGIESGRPKSTVRNAQQVATAIGAGDSTREQMPPMVIGMASNESSSQGVNLRPIAIRIAPRSKRPPYRP